MGAPAAVLMLLLMLAGRSSPGAPAVPVSSSTVNVNTADEAQLRTLPGIGRDEARKIIAGRPYMNLAEFFRKADIPPAGREMLAERLRFADAPEAPGHAAPPGAGRPGPAPAPRPKLPLDPNTATIRELSSIHGLAPYASRIVAFRPYRNLGELSKAGVPRPTILECAKSLRVGAAAGK